MPRRRYPKGKSTRDNTRSRDDDIDWRKPIPKQNEIFERYYKHQKFIPDEEWDTFMETLRSELPVVFRITGSRKHAQKLLDFMESEYMAKLVEGVEVEGERVAAPRRLVWYPDGLAFQMDVSRRFVRKSDELRRFHAWLVSETEAGNVSRQEAVSMLPPLLLDVEAGQLILDICAAPGSKTAQIVEMLEQRSSEASKGGQGQSNNRDGLIIANDVDGKRCYLMMHQVKRLHSPNVVITNHDGTNLPNLLVNRSMLEQFRTGGEMKLDANATERDRVPVQFDRVLCDVPCSGDGTLRKNPDLWSRWAPGTAISLHGVQVRLLRRALELVRVGGRVVYSTCSLNPVENEAVIASLLRSANYNSEADSNSADKFSSYSSCIEVVDCSKELEGLKRIEGLTQWKLMDKTGTFYDRFEDVPERMQRHFRPSMFPPQDAETTLKSELRKCIRVTPHYQNTGGFFVCVLRKHSELSWQRSRAKAESAAAEPNAEAGAEAEAASGSDNDEPSKRARVDNDCVVEKPSQAGPSATNEPARNRGAIRNPGFREPPFRFIDPQNDPLDVQLIENLRNYFGISTDFRFDQLFARGERTNKTWANIYLASPFVRELVVNNSDRIHFVNLGLRALIRNEDVSGGKCLSDYRIAQEALLALDRFVGTQRRLPIGKSDCIALLSSPIPPLSVLSFETREAFGRIDLGPVIFECYYETEVPPPSRPVGDEANADASTNRFLMGGWRGRSTLRAYLPVYERRNLLTLCGVHPDPVETQKPAGQDGEKSTDANEDDAGDDSGDGAVEAAMDSEVAQS